MVSNQCILLIRPCASRMKTAIKDSRSSTNREVLSKPLLHWIQQRDTCELALSGVRAHTVTGICTSKHTQNLLFA